MDDESHRRLVNCNALQRVKRLASKTTMGKLYRVKFTKDKINRNKVIEQK